MYRLSAWLPFCIAIGGLDDGNDRGGYFDKITFEDLIIVLWQNSNFYGHTGLWGVELLGNFHISQMAQWFCSQVKTQEYLNKLLS